MERLVERASTIRLGDTRDWETDMGPVVSARQHERILGYTESGKAEGATLALGGGVPAGFDRGHWIEPTIFTGVRNDMRIAREEIFRPGALGDPLRRRGRGHRAGQTTPSTAWPRRSGARTTRALDVAEKIQAGSVWINDAHQIDCEVPFGGYKQSGVGRELGPNALDPFTEVKNLHLDLSGRRESRLLDAARRAAGLSQDELATRAGTSRPTLSSYEHGHRSPTMATATRILAAAGHELTAFPTITFAERPSGHGRSILVPSRLPRLDPAQALATVVLPLHLNWSEPGRAFDLRDRRQRARVYEIVLREGARTTSSSMSTAS